MLTIQINGQVQQLESTLTLREMLARLHISPVAMAIAVNEEIVPRSELENRQVQDGDTIEVVQAVGGG